MYEVQASDPVHLFDYLAFDYEMIIGLQSAAGIFKENIKLYLDADELKNNAKLSELPADVQTTVIGLMILQTHFIA